MKRKIGLIVTVVLLIGAIVWLAVSEDNLAGFSATLKSFGLTRFLLAIALSCLITALGSARYWLLVNDVGHKISFRNANTIFASSALGGLAFFQFYGQTAVRSALMKRHGITPEDVLIISLIERATGLLVLLILTAFAGSFLISDIMPGEVFLRGELLMLAVAAATISVIVVKLLKPALLELGLRELANTIGRAGAKAALVTVAMHGLTLLTFLIFLAPLESTGDLRAEVSVSLIVMFAASIPISFSGWGIRELSAAFVFGLIGLEVSESVAVSVAVGITSLIALLIYSLATWRRVITDKNIPNELPDDAIAAGRGPLIPRGFFALAVGCAVAVLIIFQIRLPVGDGFVMVNLADPIIIFSSVVSILVLLQKYRDGEIQINKAPLYALAVGLGIFILGLMLGYSRFGYTDWAFVNKAVGILLLIGYCLCGIYATSIGRGFSSGVIIPRVYIISVAVVVGTVSLWSIGRVLAPTLFLELPGRMEGFSKNPNAFGFQLCVALALLVGFMNSKLRMGIWWLLAAGFIFLGIHESTSRAAMLVIIAIGLALPCLKLSRPIIPLLGGIGFAVVLNFPAAFLDWGLSYLDSLMSIPWIEAWVGKYYIWSLDHLSNHVMSGNADSFRWQTLAGGFQMFLDNPVFGAGLGAYYLQSGIDGDPFVIHSTPIWILAEFGLVGSAVFVIGLVLLIKHGLELMKKFKTRQRYEFDFGTALIFLVVVFFVSGIPHEMFYQRTFWFFVGVCASGMFLKILSPPRQYDDAGDEELNLN
tara:strand:+ start:815 stop:3103 length:2289 start_codon:yes stop_codon:yes gene_type:complete